MDGSVVEHDDREYPCVYGVQFGKNEALLSAALFIDLHCNVSIYCHGESSDHFSPRSPPFIPLVHHRSSFFRTHQSFLKLMTLQPSQTDDFRLHAAGRSAPPGAMCLTVKIFEAVVIVGKLSLD
jgi:hypothetical protein